ncbi:MAG: 50S ribosomal protein L18 [Phototrophicales bacterium]|nr:MAG: 50S ribosomal protein L18 [Phototrophicales bacterium]
MAKTNQRAASRLRRHRRMRNRVVGTPERPRLNVYRSLQHIYAQVIDDINGKTLVSASTIDKEVAAKAAGKSGVEAAQIVGQVVGERAKKAGINTVVFDRGGYKYHGRVAALAAGAREAGLEF